MLLVLVIKQFEYWFDNLGRRGNGSTSICSAVLFLPEPFIELPVRLIHAQRFCYVVASEIIRPAVLGCHHLIGRIEYLFLVFPINLSFHFYSPETARR